MISNMTDLVDTTEFYRIEANQKLDKKTRAELGQYTTPAAVARFMASFFDETEDEIILLDPGAGVGSLTSAFIQRQLAGGLSPPKISVDAYELDPFMLNYLERTLERCQHECAHSGIEFSAQVVNDDFIERGVELLWNAGSLFGQPFLGYTHCIMNPPYKKIRSDSDHRRKLRQIDIEATNLYSAFMALGIKILVPGGQFVAIIPRSFCNGVYFKPFRQLLLSEMAIKHLHIFDSRTQAFKEDSVLQENIIIYAVKHEPQGDVTVTSSSDPSLSDMTLREATFDSIVKPDDPDQFIHIATTAFDQMVIDRIGVFTHSLHDLDLDVSTGPVVEFRLRPDLRQRPERNTHPLIYPSHFRDNRVQWPADNGKKPNAIRESTQSRRWLMPNGWYVLTRRISSKEEPRRIVAALHDPKLVPGEKIGFENHVNVFHRRKAGVDPLVAKGLAVFLNSSLVDLYFRQFSGHTQVNATDLRMMHYPDIEVLSRLGKQVNNSFPQQDKIDSMLESEIGRLFHNGKNYGNPMTIQQRIQDALSILSALGMPRGQQNERSALTLLALFDVTPEDEWGNASAPLMGITPIMDFVREHYGRSYAPNTRETFRRQTMHQFVDAGVAMPNPDQPDRPVNSPKWVYQIEVNVLDLIRTFGSSDWEMNLENYLVRQPTLAEQYAREREMKMVPLILGEEQKLYLSPGDHSMLIRDIVEQFGPRFAPGAEVLYVGDTGTKLGHFDEETFKELGLEFDSHGKFPDVVMYYREKDWLLLIEAVTSHGPVDAKRHFELMALFDNSTAGLVFVTAFPDRRKLNKYLADISWETEVWIAETPTHLIHFDGEQFLGPHE